MKLTVIAVLVVFASVAVLRAEEIDQDSQEEVEPSLTAVYDGTLEDEVLGNEDDPAHFKKRKQMRQNIGDMRVCGRVFGKCLMKTKARCKLVPVCKVQYFACRCILKGTRKCVKFLRWVKKMAKKHGKHDDIEQDEEEDAGKKGKKMKKFRKIVRKCGRGYKACSRGKVFCGPCLKKFGGCLKKHFIKHICKKHGHSSKGDEPVDEEDDNDKAMANMVEHEDTEEDVQQVDQDESEDAHKGKKRPSPAMIKCGKYGLKCMLRAKMNCRQQGRCMRRVIRCVRLAKRRGKHDA